MTTPDINRHFKREAKIMIGIFFAIVVLGLVMGLIGPYVLTFFDVDRCLDGGGSFDYESCACDHNESHPGSGIGKCE